MRSERIRKTQSPCAKFLTAVLLLMLFFVYGVGNADKVKPTVPLPPPGFEFDQTRSDPDRPVRKFKEPYQGPIFDTHAHLDPPRMKKGSLVEAETAGDVVKSIRKAGVDRIIIMPVPNEGQMGGSREGAKYRKKLLKKNPVLFFDSVEANISPTGCMMPITMDTGHPVWIACWKNCPKIWVIPSVAELGRSGFTILTKPACRM